MKPELHREDGIGEDGNKFVKLWFIAPIDGERRGFKRIILNDVTPERATRGMDNLYKKINRCLQFGWTADDDKESSPMGYMCIYCGTKTNIKGLGKPCACRSKPHS